MKASDFEEKVWAVDTVRIVVRAASTATVKDYGYTRAATETWSINEFLSKRISGHVGKHDVVVIDGSGEQPHRGSILRSLRRSYE